MGMHFVCTRRVTYLSILAPYPEIRVAPQKASASLCVKIEPKAVISRRS